MSGLLLPQVTTSAWRRLPGGRSVACPLFAIGDVHGCDVQLEAMHDAARRIIADDDLSAVLMIRLGDYIDRGPNTPRTLDLVNRGLELAEVREINLLGNHEQLLLNALFSEDRNTALSSADAWLRNGGRAVCHDLDIPLELVEAHKLPVLRPLLRERLGPERLELLLSLRTSVTLHGGLVFIHAGLNPLISPSLFFQQTWRDYDSSIGAESPYWIRDEFLEWCRPLHDNLLVVHGHTVEESGPVLRDHRIGLDGGCVRNGRLLMGEFRCSRFRVHATVPLLPARSPALAGDTAGSA